MPFAPGWGMLPIMGVPSTGPPFIAAIWAAICGLFIAETRLDGLSASARRRRRAGEMQARGGGTRRDVVDALRCCSGRDYKDIERLSLPRARGSEAARMGEAPKGG